MALETATIEHACNVVRRQIQDEFPDLTLNFIVYNKENPGQTLNIRRPELENHPAWPNLQPALKKAQPSDFCLITKGKEKKLLKFLAREKTLACLFFPEDDLHRDPDYIRQQALSHAWHVLNAPPPGAGVIRANYKDETTLAWHNMLADAFGALVMEMQGKRGFIKALARRRSALALDPHAGYRPELYPYPVVMDAAQLVYDDTRRAGALSKTRLFAQALEMTAEIGMTFEQTTVLQWWAFARPAQEMAWLGIERNKILGAAIHTSEDPYARSTAYLVAEMLGIDPPQPDNALYNPFTDYEAAERHHRKLCDEVFKDLLQKATPEDNGDIFRDAALEQNHKLLEGRLVGWCAPGLIAAAQAFDKDMPHTAKMQEVKQAFVEGYRKMNTDVLRSLGHILIALRQAGEEITREKIAEAALKNEHIIVQDLSDALLFK